MADLLSVQKSHPTREMHGLTFALLESIDDNSVRVSINDQEFLFKYVWENRATPELVIIKDRVINITNTFTEHCGKGPERVYVFWIAPYMNANTVPKNHQRDLSTL